MPREAGYVALMEACLVVLRDPEQMSQDAPAYAPSIPDLWRVPDALARIAEFLNGTLEGAFRRSYPDFRPANQNIETAAAA